MRAAAFLFLAVCLPGAMTSRNIAAAALHPVSHVDAWLIVRDDALELRLITFLDDVIRHQQPTVREDGTIAMTDFRSAAGRHGDWLREHVRIFDQQGTPGVLELTELPDLDTLPSPVDPVADAAIRLTWQYRATLSQPVKALTFLPLLFHETLATRPELRLHIRDVARGRRIDATVFDATSHTVVLESSTSGPAGIRAVPAVADDVNRLQLSLVAAGRTLVVELSGPAMLLSASQESAAGDSEDPAPGDGSPLTIADQRKLLERAIIGQVHLEWRQGERIRAVSARARYFLTADPLQDIAAAESEAAYDPAVLSVSVQLEYPLEIHQGAPQLVWQPVPVLQTEVSVSSLTPGGAKSETVAIEQGQLRYSLEETWSALRRSSVPGPLSAAAMPWSVHRRHSPRRAWLVALGLCIPWAASAWIWRRKIAVISGGVVVVSIVGAVALRDRQEVRVVDCPAAEHIVRQLLDKAVRVASLPGTDETADALLRIMAPSLAEPVFLGLQRSLSEVDEEGRGFVLSLDRTEFAARNCSVSQGPERMITVAGEWQIQGRVFHWGHLHDRAVHCSGTLRAVCRDDHWLLQSVVLTEVQSRAATPPSRPL